MGKRTIKLTVCDEYVRGAGVPVGAAGSHDEVELEVTFVGDVWLGTNKHVTFRDALGQSPRLKMLLDSETVRSVAENDNGEICETIVVSVPYAAKLHAGNMSVTFTGYTVATETDGDVTTAYEDTCVHTTTAYFRVLPSDYVILEDGSFENDLTLAQQLQIAFSNFTSQFDGEDGLIAQMNTAIESAKCVTGEAQQAIITMTRQADEAHSNALTAASAAATAAESANKAEESSKAVEKMLGNIETAIDKILKIQNSLMGGDTE